MSRLGIFLFGTFTGGLIVWLYGQDVRDYIDDKTRTARARAADTLGAAAERLEAAKERIESGLVVQPAA